MSNIFIVSPRIDLPEDVRLEIEFDAAVDEVQETSADGGLMTWRRARQYRKNALIGGQDVAPITRATLQSLRTLASSMPGRLELAYIDSVLLFEFDYADGPISASPVIPRPNASGADTYNNLKIAIIERGTRPLDEGETFPPADPPAVQVVMLPDLPEADPLVDGQLWNDDGVLKISEG